MFNMFRMDIYRLIRSRFVYVCLALIIGMQALSYLMIYMVGTEEGREAATQAGMIVTVDGEEEIVLEGVDSLVMYRQALMDGGAYATIFGIASVLFLCSDFQGGFLKNIMTQHRQRWKYIGSKLIALGSLNLIYLLLSVGANYLLNLLWKGLVPSVPLSFLSDVDLACHHGLWGNDHYGQCLYPQHCGGSPDSSIHVQRPFDAPSLGSYGAF